MPRNSSGQELHPHRERADAVAAAVVPTPIAVEAKVVEVAEADTVTVHAQGVGPRPVVAERDALTSTRVLEVGQDEAREQGGTTEV